MEGVESKQGSWLSEFTNLYPVSKTLRFKLIPQGRTQEWIDKKGFLKQDRSRVEDSRTVKDFIDDYHRWFINDVLCSIQIEGWDELASALTASNRESNKEKLKKLQEKQRKAIAQAFSERPEYKQLTKDFKDLFSKNLPYWMKAHGYTEQQIECVKSFKGFTTYFTKLKENRINMYVAEPQATAIAYRAVDENFSKFVANKKLLEDASKEAPNLCAEMQNLAPAGSYNKYLSPQGITYYNEQIGKINSLLNEAYQQGLLHKRKRAQVLYKQILCEGESSFEAPIQIENDCELFDSIEALLDFWETSEDGNPLTISQNLGEVMKESDSAKVYVEDKHLSDLSGAVCLRKSDLPQAVELCGVEKIGPLQGANKKDAEKWAERKEATQYSLSDLLQAYAAVYPDESELCLDVVAERYQAEIKQRCVQIKASRESYEQLVERYRSSADAVPAKALLSNDADIQIVKSFLDSIKELEYTLKVFEVSPESEKDAAFYPVFDNCLAQILCVDVLYNRVRNYVTQKPYSTEKFKLNFDCPTLAAGWDKNKETANLCILFQRNGCYYLGVMDASVRIDFDGYLDDDASDFYEKVAYKLLPNPNQMLPKVSISSRKGRESFPPTDKLYSGYQDGKHKKANFDQEFCFELIDYFKGVVRSYPGWDVFDFKFSPTQSYSDISDFYNEVASQGYYLGFNKIAKSTIDILVDSGKLYLFQIYNKDFSEKSTGNKNLHSLYWEQVFSPVNAKNGYPFRLNGGAELFYRPASIKKPLKHAKNSILLNKTYTDAEGIRKSISDAVYKELQEVFSGRKSLSDVPAEYAAEVTALYNSGRLETREAPHEIVKDKRYTQDQYTFHVPITLNANSNGNSGVLDMNSKVLRCAKEGADVTFLGIDRGERHLLYLCLINKQGEILMQKTLNTVPVKQKQSTLEIDYHQKLDIKEKERDAARKSWSSIGKIAEIKQGYLSQVVHEIADIVTEHNAVLVMEDLNFGFKRGRFKVEKQVYQKFEKQLIDKFSYLAQKPNDNCDTWDMGGIGQAYQLVPKFESFKKLRKQHGAILYIPAWNTSHIDPSTGFMNQFRFSKSSVEFWQEFFSCMRSISFNKGKGYFEFKFAYSDFPGQMVRGKDAQDSWTVCSWCDGYLVSTKDEVSGKWSTESIDVNQRLKDLFNKEGIAFAGGQDIKDAICSMSDIKQLGWLFKRLVQLRNSRTGTDEDYILSPVQGPDGIFFDSRKASAGQPKDADANGAYHIALKGLQALENLEEDGKTGRYKIAKTSNEEWTAWIQNFHGLGK